MSSSPGPSTSSTTTMPRAVVRMIDFAHSTFTGFMNDPVLHSGPDKGYLKGLDTIADLLESALVNGDAMPTAQWGESDAQPSNSDDTQIASVTQIASMTPTAQLLTVPQIASNENCERADF